MKNYIFLYGYMYHPPRVQLFICYPYGCESIITVTILAVTFTFMSLWRRDSTLSKSYIKCVLKIPTFYTKLVSLSYLLSLSGVDCHDCISPGFSVLCELWIICFLSSLSPLCPSTSHCLRAFLEVSSLPPSSLLFPWQHSCHHFPLHGHTTNSVSE